MGLPALVVAFKLRSMPMPARVLTSRNLALRLVAAALCAIGLSGCQSIEGTSPQSAGIRFVDAVPDSQTGLDFLLNKNVQVYNFGYTSFTQNYLSLAAGNYTVAVAPSGNDAQVLASTSLGVKTGSRYTVIAGNINASLQLNAYTDLIGPAPSGTVSVRVIDESTETGAIDLYLVPQDGTLLTTKPVYTGLTFTGTTGYLNVPAGTYTLIAVPNGTVPIPATIATYTGSQETYSAGAVRTFVLYDDTISTTSPLKSINLTDYN